MKINEDERSHPSRIRLSGTPPHIIGAWSEKHASDVNQCTRLKMEPYAASTGEVLSTHWLSPRRGEWHFWSMRQQTGLPVSFVQQTGLSP